MVFVYYIRYSPTGMWYTGVAYTSVTSATHASDCSRRAAIDDVTFTRTPRLSGVTTSVSFPPAASMASA